MTCRWVTESRITTFGRRVIITSAVFGLTTMGSAGIAVAASDTVGVSPSAKVVAVAPTAVSVTFREALRSGGAQLRVLSADGEVGTGKVTTGQKTLRRSLRLGAPQGSYTVEWKAVSVKGKRMSGSFTFFAARSNGEVKQSSPVPSPPVTTEAVPDPTASAQVIDPNGPTAGPTASAVEPTTVVTPAATSQSSGPEEWITGTDPIWTPQPTVTGVLSAGGSGRSGSDPSVTTGLTAIPLAVGGLLVLAAGMVSLVNRPRLRGLR
jgi:methionine-rich copper-binding protein CopC